MFLKLGEGGEEPPKSSEGYYILSLTLFSKTDAVLEMGAWTVSVLHRAITTGVPWRNISYVTDWQWWLHPLQSPWSYDMLVAIVSYHTYLDICCFLPSRLRWCVRCHRNNDDDGYIYWVLTKCPELCWGLCMQSHFILTITLWSSYWDHTHFMDE